MSGTNTKKRRRIKFIRESRHDFVFIADNEDGTNEIVAGKKLETGQPLPPGMNLYSIERGEDGRPVVETVAEAASSGPAKVTSPAYRKGFDAVFGRQKRGEC